MPGATLTLAAAGTYVVTGQFQYRELGTGDESGFFVGRLLVDGVEQPGTAVARILNNQSVLVSRTWVVVVGAGDVVHLEAKKNTGTGSSKVRGPGGAGSSIIAIGP